ncbi:hypothetical protein [Streptomyces griseus]|uniref:hypothetical protein n=1 Tax=Streptomyces griseus TaxID=1911 RepID=UPI00055B32EF|nr:hypothetical protein [Streptomyces griseus]
MIGTVVVGAGPTGLFLAGDPATAGVPVTLLEQRPVRRRALARVTGIGYRYASPRRSHPLTGARVPDVRPADGNRLHEALRGRFVLITPETYADRGGREDRDGTTARTG